MLPMRDVGHISACKRGIIVAKQWSGSLDR